MVPAPGSLPCPAQRPRFGGNTLPVARVNNTILSLWVWCDVVGCGLFCRRRDGLSAEESEHAQSDNHSLTPNPFRKVHPHSHSHTHIHSPSLTHMYIFSLYMCLLYTTEVW